MHVMLLGPLARNEIVARLGGIEGVVVSCFDDTTQLAASIAEADVLVTTAALYDADLAALLKSAAPRLRWIQLLTAGFETTQIFGVPDGVTVMNAGAAWSPAVAEHAMTLLLALLRRIPETLANQARQGWDRSFSSRIETANGQSLAIVGFGSIGREVAVRARAFGMRILGVSRSARPDALLDESHPVSNLPAVLARSDAAILAVPHSAETLGMFNSDMFAACKPGMVIVNVARGTVIDSSALGAALHRGHLGGAGLDVTDPEPLPADHALWRAPNLIVSPHVAGASGASIRTRLADVVHANVARLAAGGKPHHVVA